MKFCFKIILKSNTYRRLIWGLEIIGQNACMQILKETYGVVLWSIQHCKCDLSYQPYSYE